MTHEELERYVPDLRGDVTGLQADVAAIKSRSLFGRVKGLASWLVDHRGALSWALNAVLLVALVTGGGGIVTNFKGCERVPDGPVDPKPDALTETLQRAYTADTDPAKAAKTRTLAVLLDSVVQVAQASGSIKTALDFQVAVKKSADLAIGLDAIPKVRAAVGGYLVTVLPTDPNTPADTAYWSKAGVEYDKASKGLSQVK